MRKILFHLNSLGKGGAERVVSLLAGEFAKDGIQTVIATEWEEKEEYRLHEKVRRIHAGLSEHEEKASRIAKQWIRVRNLRKVILAEKPDVVVSFCVKANYRAMMAVTGLKIPVVVSVRNNPKIDYVGRVHYVMNKVFLNKASGCVFQTEEARSFFDECLQKKSVIIPNPINEKFLEADRTEPEKKIVTVGRLAKQKNHLLLIQAFEEVLKEYPDYQLLIYGGDADESHKAVVLDYLNKGSLELKKAVRFMGLSAALETELADAAMFVLSSDYEGMPNALMEAMALGLPVISTDCPCGGSRYWITPGETGQLTPVGDAEKLAEAMRYYMTHQETAEAMGLRGKERMQEATLDKIYRQWKTYLQEAVFNVKIKR